MTRHLIAAALTVVLAVPAVAAEVLPDRNKTPGSVRPDTLSLICGHAVEHRGVMTNARRDEVLMRYKLPPGAHPDYEIDHLVPLCLGGSDDASNLWPEPRRSIEPKWNAEAKDRLRTRTLRSRLRRHARSRRRADRDHHRLDCRLSPLCGMRDAQPGGCQLGGACSGPAEARWHVCALRLSFGQCPPRVRLAPVARRTAPAPF